MMLSISCKIKLKKIFNKYLKTKTILNFDHFFFFMFLLIIIFAIFSLFLFIIKKRNKIIIIKELIKKELKRDN